MSYQLIDMTKDPRSGQFAYFRQMLFPFAGVTAEVDITDFAARRQGRPFFLSFLYAVVRAADGVYVSCTVEGDLPYEAFVALGQRRQRGLSQELSQKKILQFRLQAKGVMYHVSSLSRTQ